MFRHAIALVALLTATALLVSGLTGCQEEESAETTDRPDASAETAYVNNYCPIMQQNKISGNVPDSLVTEFKGQKVAFCCAGCPAAWEELSEQEKIAKLQAVGVDLSELQN
jgi:hypothetical protein